MRAAAIIVVFGLAGCRTGRDAYREVCPEQTQLEVRQPEAFPRTPLPTVAPPRTVTNPDNGQPELTLSLDQAIRIALDNSEVIRVLAGVTAVSSGQTMYDPAIANASIDQQRGRFDPTISIGNTFSSDDTPMLEFDPGPPKKTQIVGSNVNAYTYSGEISKTNPLGGTAGLSTGVVRSDLEPGPSPLDPQARYFTELSYVQPLLQGAGLEVNLAPVIISRLNTEQSFFQFKDAMQELVRGVIEAYWELVFARTDRWAREQQIEQAKFAYEREQARFPEFANIADVSQARLALANFQANYVSAQSNVLNREAALLNILGISPTEAGEVIPTTAPHFDRVEFRWMELVSLAEQYRPDIIELKLIIDADEQRLVQARNTARPNLDAVARYRWDGLRGETPSGRTIGTNGDAYTDWTLGVNFSVPLGLRQARAAERQQELVIVRDRANLRQGLHSATHQLALELRTTDQAFEQYKAFLVTREAARDNLSKQLAEVQNNRTILLNLLQAIANWGDAVSAEAQALTQYNTQLANLERQSGTILETHGVRFLEERFRFAGPLCRHDWCYTGRMSPTENQAKYQAGAVPAEDAFDLEKPAVTPGDIQPYRPPPPQPEPASPVQPASAATERVTPSLITQGLNRVEAACAPRRVKAEKDADGRREHDRDAGGRQ